MPGRSVLMGVYRVYFLIPFSLNDGFNFDCVDGKVRSNQ